MNRFALIAGTGSAGLLAASRSMAPRVDTPFGLSSSAIHESVIGQATVGLIARHGDDSSVPPHLVNYRANIWALHEWRPEFIVSVNAVGGISPAASTGTLVIPDQIIDYTCGREHTFADGRPGSLQHIEFTEPFNEPLRQQLLAAGASAGLDVLATGTYGVMQGPRLETAAEIVRLERDGCDLVGMTVMPEASLARELAIDYASVAVIVNRAAGKGSPGADIHAEISHAIAEGIAATERLIRHL